jgi:dolichol-phosphate mannosyltransferase
VRAGDDIVIASRFEGHGKMIGCPWLRATLSIGVSWLMRLLVRLPHVKDYSTFYKAYRMRVLKEGFELYGDRLLAGEGFAVSCGQLIKLSNITKRIAEVPLVLRYDMKGGRSGMKLLRTLRGYLRLIWQSVTTRNFRRR